MARTIFYSWQNDLDCKKHKYFIDNCIKSALKVLEKDALIYMEYDRDTRGNMGSPDIINTIFEKIENSVLFICDISIINSFDHGKKTPNPNVMIELGFAAHKLGWERIICLFDSATGNLVDLPFDLRQKRITPFDPDRPNELKRITGIISENIKSLFISGQLFNPLNDFMKGKIDKAFLDVGKQLTNLVFGTYTWSEGLANIKKLLSLTEEQIQKILSVSEFPGFIVLNNYEKTSEDLREILKELFSSSYFPKEWTYSVLGLLEWIQCYRYFSSQRNEEYPFQLSNKNLYDYFSIILGQSINSSNPANSRIVLETYNKEGKKYVDVKGGKVINVTQYPCEDPEILSKTYTVKPNANNSFAKKIFTYTSLCKCWLDVTDSEFILDPDAYLII